jgi:calcium binding protein 39
MAFLWRNRPRPPSDVVRSIKELLLRIGEAPAAAKVSLTGSFYFVYAVYCTNLRLADSSIQVEDELAKQLAQMKVIVQGTQG